MIASSSSGPEYLKGMRCFCISEKYSFASCDVLVPKPGHEQSGRVRIFFFFATLFQKKGFRMTGGAYFVVSYYHTGVWDKPL